MDLPKLSPGKRFTLPRPVGSADALLLAVVAFAIVVERFWTLRYLQQEQIGELSMLGFERLTYVPFDTRLIERSLLSPAEFRWINEYHVEVFRRLSPLLEGEDLGAA